MGALPDSVAFGDAHLVALEKQLVAARESGDAAASAHVALDLARAYSRLGNLDVALSRAELALEVLEQAGLRHRLGTAHVIHGLVTFYRDRPSQALSALSRAAGYPDLGYVERAQMYDIAALSLISMVDLPTGAKVLLDQAWPHALLSGDAKTIVNQAGRCIGLLHEMALWAADIPSHFRIGLQTKAPQTKADYLAQAWHFIAEMECRFDAVGDLDRATGLAQKARVVSLQDGYVAALPIFAEAARLAAPPRLAMVVDINTGRAAAIDGRWATAREYFLLARSREFSNDDAARRILAWHMSHVEEALGRPTAALQEMREFEALESKKSKLAAEWFVDVANQRRYGKSFDIQAARDILLGKPMPAALTRATRFVDEQLGSRLTLDAVAAGANVGKRTLQQLFREHLGVTFSDFVRERRMQRADEELRAGRLRVAEVANRIGYSSAANFSRDYRKRFGRTPSTTLRARST